MPAAQVFWFAFPRVFRHADLTVAPSPRKTRAVLGAHAMAADGGMLVKADRPPFAPSTISTRAVG
ncbi:hypothetical protein CI15_20020 [Paraburkholderia monticola]|uniref:Uncharacterized protein n=1 Tax=Paraburkholderia monticola TaxID=1399968 RepID=A0A149PKB6_9BURK|nr:hypothetical protein CI15_20020 [Paraburkholderia monticola]